MTGLIAIDESGDLGPSGSRYFCIAAMVLLRSRDLKKASRLLSNDYESKWYNSSSEKRVRILQAMLDFKVKIWRTLRISNYGMIPIVIPIVIPIMIPNDYFLTTVHLPALAFSIPFHQAN